MNALQQNTTGIFFLDEPLWDSFKKFGPFENSGIVGGAYFTNQCMAYHEIFKKSSPKQLTCFQLEFTWIFL